jgi:hypothetical protein
MTKLGFIAWLALGTFFGLTILVIGITLCVSPQKYVRVHRALSPKDPIANTERWASEICSIQGRILGVVFACFGGISLYLVWFEVAWKQWPP